MVKNIFETLKVYKEAHLFVIEIYKVTKNFPRHELFGLISQIRRASVSVVANIVEGNSRNHKKEFIQFLYIANGSMVEVEYYLELAYSLGYLIKKEYDQLEGQREKAARLLVGLLQYQKRT